MKVRKITMEPTYFIKKTRYKNKKEVEEPDAAPGYMQTIVLIQNVQYQVN